jgi:hypothetical protein
MVYVERFEDGRSGTAATSGDVVGAMHSMGV